MTDPAPTPREKKSRRPGLATQVLLGFLLGVAVGLFFGEYAAFLETVGTVFIRLLQMTVLPYVVVSLVSGLGRLGMQDAGRLAVRGGLFVVLLWGIGLAVVALTPLAYPDWPSAAFFSSSLVEQPAPFDFVDQYFASNPFHALAATIVPAVVVFSVALGATMIGVRGKERIIDDLSVLGEALSRLSGFVARLAPIGVFGIAAGAAATMQLSDLGRIQVYLIPQALTALVMAFVVLPGLVSVLTPIRPVPFIRRVWGALITGFATGSLFVVLPLLAEAAKDLLEEADLDREEAAKTVDVVVPTTYNFPSTGVLLSLCFMFFAGWFIGSPVPLSRYPSFLITGLFSFFGSATLAVPFLLDLLQLPADLFQLYLTVDVIASRFGTLLASVHVTTLAILTAVAMAGRIRFRAARSGPVLVASVGAIVAVLAGSYLYFTFLVPQEYQGYRLFAAMAIRGETVPYKVIEDPGAMTADLRPVLDQIQDRGTLRVCFTKDDLPLAFRNTDGALVGYDVELAHRLAHDLGVTLEFVQVGLDARVTAIETGLCHLSTTMAMTPERSRLVTFPASHTSWTASFLVPDHRRNDFSSGEALRELGPIRIGMPEAGYYEAMLQEYLPQADVVTMKSPRPFLRGDVDDVDAFLFGAEPGSAWTLVYPDYSVAVPKPDILSIPMAYAVRRDDREWIDYLAVWIELKKTDGTIDEFHQRWILGRDATAGTPRWSVIRDVLGWVE